MNRRQSVNETRPFSDKFIKDRGRHGRHAKPRLQFMLTRRYWFIGSAEINGGMISNFSGVPGLLSFQAPLRCRHRK